MKIFACPVALHPDGAPLRIAAHIHPAHGLKLVKARVRNGEGTANIAAHKLFNTSGLETRNTLHIGTSDTIKSGEIWHFILCRIAPPVRPSWAHLPTNKSADLRLFKWLTLPPPPNELMHSRSANALEWIKANL